jgi:hypothetical protein
LSHPSQHCHRLSCRKARDLQTRQNTKAALAEWKESKAAAQKAAAVAIAADKAAKAAHEREKREARKQELQEALKQRHSQQAQTPRGVPGAAKVQTKAKAAPAARPMTAEQRAALQDRGAQMLEKRRAAMQAKKEQAETRAKVQQKLLASVRSAELDVHSFPCR